MTNKVASAPTQRWALLSVSDKTGVANFAKRLHELGFSLLSTGGTADNLRQAGLPVTDVSQLTAFPEVMDGRVKTLHPLIHGGLLGRRNVESHAQVMTQHGMPHIDIVVVNLYPFVETVASGANLQTCIENIDIGGPSMIRSAAKNSEHVAVITDPDDYDEVLEELELHKQVSLLTRQRLAAKAFSLTAAYDTAIANYLTTQSGQSFMPHASFGGALQQVLRYGENPHQRAALYSTQLRTPSVVSARMVQGKALSYNNIADADAAFNAVCDFDPATPACVIVKHANPCGVAVAPDALSAWRLALRCDPTSAFGGIVAFNTRVDVLTAQALSELFLEVVVAPHIDEDALTVLSHKKNVRVLVTGGLAPVGVRSMQVRSVTGGLLVQNRDMLCVGRDDLRVVTQRHPNEHELNDMLFAFLVAKHVHSNAIVLAANRTTLGIGAGQMNRLDSSIIAARKAGQVLKIMPERARDDCLAYGMVAASDAFFPFADGLEAAASAGVTAVIQPGGSMRDDEVIAAADARGLAMVFTGVRHFLH